MLSAGPWSEWFKGKEFSEDWSSSYFPMWMKVLGPLRETPLQVLEVGSFEGRSAIFWLEFLRNSTLTCIDHFATTKKRNGADIERRFDSNTAAYAHRIVKMKNTSATGLSRLVDDGKKFDLIYIDGCHFRDAVLIDCLLCWQMLNKEGLIILDDYGHDLQRHRSERPKDGIDCFLQLHAGEFREIARGYQVIIQRIADSQPE